MNSSSALLLGVALLGGCASAPADDVGLDDREDDREVVSLSLEERIELVQTRVDATNARDWDLWESLHAPDAIRRAPELPVPLEGRAAMRAAIETLSTAFPDYRLELRQAFGEGEWLAVRFHTQGTMTGPLVLADGTEIPPTGRSIEQDWAALVRFEGEHIAEFDEFYDQLLLMQQLGLLPE